MKENLVTLSKKYKKEAQELINYLKRTGADESTSVGVKPIVAKLPSNLQSKRVTRASKFKHFPHFMFLAISSVKQQLLWMLQVFCVKIRYLETDPNNKKKSECQKN